MGRSGKRVVASAENERKNRKKPGEGAPKKGGGEDDVGGDSRSWHCDDGRRQRKRQQPITVRNLNHEWTCP